MRRSVIITGTLLIVFLIVAFVELMAYVQSQYFINYGIGFTPLNFTEPYGSWSRRHHPRLGWLPAHDQLDAVGSRIIPAFIDPQKTPACVSLYGDSFTEGYGVDDEHAWSNVLSQLLNCRVANFGVAGYGTDQAYLRFLSNRQDQARVVILGYLTENLIRNVNQLRNLLGTVASCQLKPRFILNEQGNFTLVPLPQITKEQYEELKENPERVLNQEFFLPGGPSGFQRQKFPYIWGIIKVFPILYKNVVLRQGTYYDFYQPGHPSKALEITVAIMERFCRQARQRGQQPLVLIIPTHIDVSTYNRTGNLVYQPLIDMLKKRNLDFLDAGSKFIQFRGKALYNPESQYHLTEKGNRVLAKIVYDYLIQNNFLVQRHLAN
jgi:lysophospholipase L1-like esterase